MSDKKYILLCLDFDGKTLFRVSDNEIPAKIIDKDREFVMLPLHVEKGDTIITYRRVK